MKILSRNNLEFFDQFVGLAVKGLRSYNTSVKLTREARLDFDILYVINERCPKNNPGHRVITIYYFVLFLLFQSNLATLRINTLLPYKNLHIQVF